jgi:hypothetical protein
MDKDKSILFDENDLFTPFILIVAFFNDRFFNDLFATS